MSLILPWDSKLTFEHVVSSIGGGGVLIGWLHPRYTQDDDDAMTIDRAMVQQLRSKLSAHLHLPAHFLQRLVDTLVATEDLGFGTVFVFALFCFLFWGCFV